MTQPGSGHRSGRKSDGSEIQRASSEALGHGFTIAAAIGLFLWAGDKADRALGTSPVFALSGALTGAAAAFYRLYAHLMAAQDRKDDSGPKDGAE
jgi:hypothetical protein